VPRLLWNRGTVRRGNPAPRALRGRLRAPFLVAWLGRTIAYWKTRGTRFSGCRPFARGRQPIISAVFSFLWGRKAAIFLSACVVPRREPTSKRCVLRVIRVRVGIDVNAEFSLPVRFQGGLQRHLDVPKLFLLSLFDNSRESPHESHLSIPTIHLPRLAVDYGAKCERVPTLLKSRELTGSCRRGDPN
jgi:hypothetical protein